MFTEKKQIQVCNNCGNHGHIYYHCKKPITSLGILCYRLNPSTKKYEYLLVRRKDTLGYVDFLRGKYSEHNDYQINNIIKEMTKQEIHNILNMSYKELWNQLWNKVNDKYDLSNEHKFMYIRRFKLDLFNKFDYWDEPEWGFPKGRREFREKDFDCALREFEEETGYESSKLEIIKNLNPFEEIFTGSNLKSYKHRYFLAKIPYEYSLNDKKYQTSEISDMKWFTYEESITKIRSYNIEKIELIKNVNELLEQNCIF